MSTTLSAFIEVKYPIADKYKLLTYLSQTALELKEILDHALNNVSENVFWEIDTDFSIGNERYFVLGNGLGFSVYYNPNDSVVIVNFPYSWQRFCTDLYYNQAFKECAKVICKAIGGREIIYFSDEEDSGVASNLFFPDIPDEFALSQSVLNEFGLSLDDPCLNLVERMNSEESDITRPTSFTHPDIKEIVSYLNKCGVKENQKIGSVSVNGYFFERI